MHEVLQRKHVALLVADHFEQQELEVPLHDLQRAGMHVTVISSEGATLRGMHEANTGDELEADLILSEARSEDYDALILPGGVVNADMLRMDSKARAWAIEFLDSGRLVAAICHAPWLLVSADIVEGRRLTSYETLADDIRNAGGEWVDLPVVVDDNLITSRKPADLPQFTTAIVGWLRQSHTIQQAQNQAA